MKLRWDKFLWCVRICKTRSMAAEILSKGRIKINQVQVKPSKEVVMGDFIYYHKNTAVFTFKVIGLIDKRVGAPLVKEYIIDLTSIEEIEKFKNYQDAQKNYRNNGDGKPSKKDRRDLEGFFEFN